MHLQLQVKRSFINYPGFDDDIAVLLYGQCGVGMQFGFQVMPLNDFHVVFAQKMADIGDVGLIVVRQYYPLPRIGNHPEFPAFKIRRRISDADTIAGIVVAALEGVVDAGVVMQDKVLVKHLLYIRIPVGNYPRLQGIVEVGIPL